LSGGNAFPLPVELAIKSMTVGGVRIFSLLATDLSRRRRAEEQLAFQAHLLENVSDAILAMDEHFRITYWNSAAERLYGWMAAEVLGRTVSEVIHPELSVQEQSELNIQLAQAGRFDNQSWHRRKDGTMIWVEARRSALRAVDGRMLGYVAVNRDITEPRRAEESLREAMHEIRALNEQLERRVNERTRELDAERARWQGVVEGIADEVWVANAEGRMSLINLPDKTAMGLEEFTDKTVAEVYEEVDILNPDGQLRPLEQAPLIRSLKGEIVRGEEIMCHRQTGRTRYRQFNSAPTRDAAGHITGAVAIVRDITEHKQIEAERERLLAENERRMAELHTIVSSIADGLVIYDANGKITFTNAAAERMLGYSAADNLLTIEERTPISKPESEDGYPLESDQVPSVRALQGETVRDIVLHLPRAGWVRVSAAPFYDSRGNLQGAVSTMTDFTERKQAEERIRELNYDLRQRAVELELANEELESFSYSVSHDLRTPLASISNLAELLLREYGAQFTTGSLPYVQLIHTNAQAMEQLIQGLLTFSRTSRQPIQKQTVSQADLVRQVWEEFLGVRAGRQVELVISELPNAQADPLLLKQVWVNLLSNAIKFTRRREVARIEIDSYQEGERTVFFVRDNGAGFDMADSGNLFTVFRRLHPEEDYEGTGVGLAIVARIVHRHGGRVWAEGKIDQGATFYFTLDSTVLGNQTPVLFSDEH
jgi:PAS domain S-box-containing protein